MKRPEAATFGELWIEALNALTALELRRMPPGAVISLERIGETPHTETDQPGLKMGSKHGNENENGRREAVQESANASPAARRSVGR